MDALPDDFDIEAYTSFGSYAPIYTPFKREVFDHFDTPLARNVLTVADAIAQHAGPNGLCWTLTLKTIMGVAHLRFDAVKAGLAGLVEKDWIREIRTPLPGRRQPFVEWQLHPGRVLYIAQRHLVEAFELWRTGVPLTVKNLQLQPADLQLQYKPESESRKNQNHPESNPNNQPRERQKNFQEVAIAECQAPLPEYADEEFAHHIKNNYQTHLTVARQMIKSYGRVNVETIAQRVKNIMTETTVKKPGALLRAELRRLKFGAHV